MSSQRKARKMIGGFRLSLGYQQIMAAQAGKANSVITKLLMSKPSGNDDSKQNKENSKGNEMRGLARLAIAMDKKENEQLQKNGIHHVQVNGNVKTEDSPVKSVHPDIDTKSAWKVTSMDELRTLDRTTTLLQSRMLSSIREHSSVTNESCVTSYSSTDSSNRVEASAFNAAKEGVSQTKTGDFSANEQRSSTGKQQVDNTKEQNINEKEQVLTSEKESDSKINNNNSNLDETSNASNAGASSVNNNNQVKAINRLLVPGIEQNKHQTNQSNANNSVSPTLKQDALNSKEASNINIDQIKKSQSTADIPDDELATVSCSSALTRRWNSDRHIKRDDKKLKNKKTQLEQILGEGLDEMTLDAIGLEVKQWENVVNKPKQWHYSWHILRKDMIPVHNARS